MGERVSPTQDQKKKKKKNQTCRMYTEHGNKNNLIIQINISYSN